MKKQIRTLLAAFLSVLAILLVAGPIASAQWSGNTSDYTFTYSEIRLEDRHLEAGANIGNYQRGSEVLGILATIDNQVLGEFILQQRAGSNQELRFQEYSGTWGPTGSITVNASSLGSGTLAEQGSINIGATGVANSFLENNENITDPETVVEPTPDTAVADPETPPPTCEAAASISVAWILCAGIDATEGALNWVDSRIQEMLIVDSQTYSHEGIQTAWRVIRNFAYIILIPIMLVMVISTALGFDFVSAYTVKRALPRLVAAAIFISLSYTLCVFLIDLSHVVGKGTLGILTAPFGDDVSKMTLSSLFNVSDGTGIFQTLWGTAALATGAVVMIWLFSGTIFLLAATAFLILLARQMFIVAFLLLAPLAILAWIFPGNDKLWKTWWGSFSKLLLMFPMIMGIIAVGRIFAFIIMPPGEAAQGAFQGAILQPLMALVAYMLPYAAIPFTFKLAGGVFGTLTGMVNDRQKGLFDRQRQTRAAKVERKGRGILQQRANVARRLESSGSRGNWAKRHAAGFASRRVGGYNLEAAMSAKNAQVSKELNDQIMTGKDDDIRGLTAAHSYDYAKKYGMETAIRDGYAKRDEQGNVSYKTLGGAYVGEANVISGRKRWGNDRFAQQAAVSYEMRKAMTSEQVGGLARDYHMAVESWGMTKDEAAGAWIGPAFENQNQHIEYKGTDWETGKLKGNGRPFVDEVYEKKGTYPLSQMSAHTIEKLQEAYTIGDADTKAKVVEIAQAFVSRGGEQVEGMAGEGEDQVPILGAAGQRVGYGPPTARSQGAASVDNAVKRLASHVGLLDQNGGSRQNGGQDNA